MKMSMEVVLAVLLKVAGDGLRMDDTEIKS